MLGSVQFYEMTSLLCVFPTKTSFDNIFDIKDVFHIWTSFYDVTIYITYRMIVIQNIRDITMSTWIPTRNETKI